jgi:hypothetical protein
MGKCSQKPYKESFTHRPRVGDHCPVCVARWIQAPLNYDGGFCDNFCDPQLFRFINIVSTVS